MGREDLHLRVEDTGVLVDNCDSTVEGLHSVEGTILRDHGSQVQTELLRVHVHLDAVWETLLLAWSDLDIDLLSGQVADNSRTGRIEVGGPESSANELDEDRFGLFIAEGEDGVCGFAVDQLNAKDFGVGKRRRDGDIEGWGLRWSSDFLVRDLYIVSGCFAWAQLGFVLFGRYFQIDHT